MAYSSRNLTVDLFGTPRRPGYTPSIVSNSSKRSFVDDLPLDGSAGQSSVAAHKRRLSVSTTHSNASMGLAEGVFASQVGRPTLVAAQDRERLSNPNILRKDLLQSHYFPTHASPPSSVSSSAAGRVPGGSVRGPPRRDTLEDEIDQLESPPPPPPPPGRTLSGSSTAYRDRDRDTDAESNADLESVTEEEGLEPTGTDAESEQHAKKRSRTLTTAHQTTVLTALFAQTRFPSTEMRETVGVQLGMSARRVQIWLQNRRQALKKAQDTLQQQQQQQHQPQQPLAGAVNSIPFPTAIRPQLEARSSGNSSTPTVQYSSSQRSDSIASGSSLNRHNLERNDHLNSSARPGTHPSQIRHGSPLMRLPSLSSSVFSGSSDGFRNRTPGTEREDDYRTHYSQPSQQRPTLNRHQSRDSVSSLGSQPDAYPGQSYALPHDYQPRQPPLHQQQQLGVSGGLRSLPAIPKSRTLLPSLSDILRIKHAPPTYDPRDTPSSIATSAAGLMMSAGTPRRAAGSSTSSTHSNSGGLNFERLRISSVRPRDQYYASSTASGQSGTRYRDDEDDGEDEAQDVLDRAMNTMTASSARSFSSSSVFSGRSAAFSAFPAPPSNSNSGSLRHVSGSSSAGWSDRGSVQERSRVDSVGSMSSTNGVQLAPIRSILGQSAPLSILSSSTSRVSPAALARLMSEAEQEEGESRFSKNRNVVLGPPLELDLKRSESVSSDDTMMSCNSSDNRHDRSPTFPALARPRLSEEREGAMDLREEEQYRVPSLSFSKTPSLAGLFGSQLPPVGLGIDGNGDAPDLMGKGRRMSLEATKKFYLSYGRST